MAKELISEYGTDSRWPLSNYPPDVVFVVNGRPITRRDLLDSKRDRQRRKLAVIREINEVIKPCFIWTFHVDGFAYYGWHLYIKTLKSDWWISRNVHWDYGRFCLKAMRLYPCGCQAEIKNIRPWMEAFAEQHHWPTRKRPSNQGLAIARAKFNPLTGKLIDILPMSEEARDGAEE